MEVSIVQMFVILHSKIRIVFRGDKYAHRPGQSVDDSVTSETQSLCLCIESEHRHVIKENLLVTQMYIIMHEVN